MLVLDVSVALSWLLADGKPADRAYVDGVLDALRSPDLRALVPVTWGLEIANVVARAEARDLVTEAQSEVFLDMLSCLAIQTDPATSVHALTDTLYLARRYGLSSYDATYLELALRAGLPLATLDVDLAKAARRAGVKRFGTR